MRYLRNEPRQQTGQAAETTITRPAYETVTNIRDNTYHIIVADDDDDDQYLITEALRETVSSHSVKTVNNGQELVKLLFNDDGSASGVIPDFILLDLNMPLLDGYAVLEQVRANEFTKTIPVFVLSTSRFDHDRQRSKELGANGFYSKPYHFDELKSIIRDICAESLSGEY